MEFLTLLLSSCLMLVAISIVTAAIVALLRLIFRVIPERLTGILLILVLISSLLFYYVGVVNGSLRPSGFTLTAVVPVFLVIVGLIIRALLGHWVRDRQLRQVASDYWLAIIVYLVVSFVVAEITNWHWLVLLILALTGVFSVAVGIFEIGTDLASWAGRIFMIILQFITVYAARLGRFLHRLSRSLYQWYVKHIRTPVETRLKKVEDHVTGILNSMGLNPPVRSGPTRRSFMDRLNRRRKP